MPKITARRYLSIHSGHLAYSIFAIATLNLVTVRRVHPALLIAAFCCLAGWVVLHFRRIPSLGRALLLGPMLALGYYAKAPFFPMGTVVAGSLLSMEGSVPSVVPSPWKRIDGTDASVYFFHANP